MKIIRYQYQEKDESIWEFSEVELRKLNLLVGNSGSGKSRFLNTIFSLGVNVVRNKISKHGEWNLTFSINQDIFTWHISIIKLSNGELEVEKEILTKIEGESNQTIIKRNRKEISFFDSPLPTLNLESVGISIFKEDERIKSIYDGFSLIMKRNFFSNELEDNTKYQISFSEKGADNLQELFQKNLSLNWKIYFLSEHFPKIYKNIKEQYKEIFPFVKSIQIKDLKNLRPDWRTAGFVPVFCIKENHVESWIPVGQLSSGMQKVLLILTDINSLPNGAIYMLDEYENSLGINAINFLPTLLNDIEQEAQFFITSHHPYIINSITADNWFIFHRNGSKVHVNYGQKNLERFGKSKQQRFLQLLNDPFFNEGIE